MVITGDDRQNPAESYKAVIIADIMVGKKGRMSVILHYPATLSTSSTVVIPSAAFKSA